MPLSAECWVLADLGADLASDFLAALRLTGLGFAAAAAAAASGSAASLAFSSCAAALHEQMQATACMSMIWQGHTSDC